MLPKVSVILINYNSFQITCDCIESVIKCTHEVECEIILVDNASLECKAELFSERFPGIKLIKSTENLGFAKGNNLGIAHANSDTILLLNSDTILVNDAISISFNKLYSQPNIGAVGAQLQYQDGRIQHNAGRFPSITLSFFKLLFIDKLFSKQKRSQIYLGFEFDHKAEAYPDWLWGTFLMIKREVINSLPSKKLPDDLFMYGEDLEWGYAIAKAGYKTLFYPEAKVIHLVGQSNYSNVLSTIKKNKKLVVRKYKGWLYANIYIFVDSLKEISLGVRNRLNLLVHPR